MTLQLSKQQERMAYLMCEEGLSYKEIAVRMNLTQHTVRMYFCRIYRKMGPLQQGTGQARMHLAIWYWKRIIARYAGKEAA